MLGGAPEPQSRAFIPFHLPVIPHIGVHKAGPVSNKSGMSFWPSYITIWLTQFCDICQRLYFLISFPLKSHRWEREHLIVWFAVSHQQQSTLLSLTTHLEGEAGSLITARNKLAVAINGELIFRKHSSIPTPSAAQKKNKAQPTYLNLLCALAFRITTSYW